MNGVGLACFQDAQKSAAGMHSVGAGGCIRRVGLRPGALESALAFNAWRLDHFGVP